jgi:hypothetical protein
MTQPTLSNAGADTNIDPFTLYPKGSGMVTMNQPVAWHHPDCAGVCLACLIELKVYEEYGQQGLDYLRKRVQTPRKEWVGLTSEELAQLTIDNIGYPTRLTAAIEAKLKELNT